MSENLWPTDFGVIAEKTPVAILREQAQALGERTANIVVGRVSATQGTAPNKFRHVLSLYCAPMSYSLNFLYVEHEIDLYPADIYVVGENTSVHAQNPDEFTARLKEIFSRDKTKKTIASLIAQSKE